MGGTPGAVRSPFSVPGSGYRGRSCPGRLTQPPAAGDLRAPPPQCPWATEGTQRVPSGPPQVPQHLRAGPGALGCGASGAARGRGLGLLPSLRLLDGRRSPPCPLPVPGHAPLLPALSLTNEEVGSRFGRSPRAPYLCSGCGGRDREREEAGGKGGCSPGAPARAVPEGCCRICLRAEPPPGHLWSLVVAGDFPRWWPWEPASSVTRSRGLPPGSGRSARAGPTRLSSSGKGPRWASTSASSSFATGAGTAQPWERGPSSGRS